MMHAAAHSGGDRRGAASVTHSPSFGKPVTARWIPPARRRGAGLSSRIGLSRLASILLFTWSLCAGITVPGSAAEATPAPAVSRPDSIEFIQEMQQLNLKHQDLTATISTLANVSAIRTDIEGTITQLDDLERRAAALRVSGTAGFNQVSDLKGLNWTIREGLKKQMDDLGQRLQLVEQLRQSWLQERDRWQGWLAAPAAEGDSDPAQLEEGISLAAKSLDDIRQLSDPLFDLQGRLNATLNRTSTVATELDAVQKTIREEVFKRASPAMWTGAYLRRLNGDLFITFRDNLAGTIGLTAVLPENQSWKAALQLILTLAVALFLRGVPAGDAGKTWVIITRKPFAAALFAIFTLSPLMYSNPSPLLSFVFWLVLGLTTTRLISGFSLGPWKKRLLYLLAVLFLLSKLMRIIDFPVPFFRIFIAASAAASGAMCIYLQYRARHRQQSRLRRILLSIGMILACFILLAELIGFHTLATQVFESLIETSFLVMLGVMFTIMGRDALELVIDKLPIAGLQSAKNRDYLLKRGNVIITILAATIILLFTLTAWRLYDTPVQAWRQISSIGFTFGATTITLYKLMLALVLLFATLFFSNVLQAFLSQQVYPRKQISEGIGFSINRLLHYGLILVGFLLMMGAVGFNLSNLAILGGAVGIGIGFGLQMIVNNFVSGLILLIERPVKVGDIVVIGETWGKILKLGLRATIIETFDKSEIIIPNSELITNQVTNWTRLDRTARLKIPAGVAYGSDVERVMAIIMKVGRSYPGVLSYPEPTVLFNGFGDSSLDFELWVWLRDLSDRLPAKTAILKGIYEEFTAAGIEIPFPQRDIHIRSAPPAEPGTGT
ncbi:mechanosensitive ion channel [bacterium]|nr:mechanosensitive ion channel [candidate division CSSED10-310 bacterium]